MNKKKILKAAMTACEDTHYLHVTRKQIADEASCPESLISYHMGTMPQMRQAIVGEAIRVRNWPVLSQALIDGNERVLLLKNEIIENLLLELDNLKNSE